ncbi:MAG: heavy metal-responsive transcriptional regulator [Chloroflexota bacterium]
MSWHSGPMAAGSMRIGELATLVGVNPKTIRYYESIGLLPEPKRRPSGYRLYGADDVERLAFIRRAQRFGLRLDEIGEVLALRDRGERPCAYVIGAVRRELRDLDERITELNAAREQLAALLARAESLPGPAGRYCELIEHREVEAK